MQINNFRATKRTYIELFRIALPNGLALIAEFIEEQKPPEAVLFDESREAYERERSDAAEGELEDAVIGAAVLAVAGGAGEDEVGDAGDDNGHGHEHRP